MIITVTVAIYSLESFVDPLKRSVTNNDTTWYKFLMREYIAEFVMRKFDK